MPYIVGLTGGIGSGKSAAARIFEELGATVIDTDAIAHALTSPGGAAIAPIRAAFGADYLTPEDALARPRMRELVFADAAKKRLLALTPASYTGNAATQARNLAKTKS